MTDEFKTLLQNLLGPNLVFVVFAVIGFIWFLSFITKSFREIWVNSVQLILPNSETKQRIHNRQLFAAHIQSEIERLNRKESWQDSHFTELEAEVEIDGQWRNPKYRWLPMRFTSSGQKRVPTLSEALEYSSAKRILLEGDPGSGKSVALRHIAIRLAKKAADRRDLRSVIPLYINLKDLVRLPNDKVDRGFIKRFIFESIKNELDSDIERFVESEFDKGIHNGTWLFLFDSFDEIPEVLSSTETDNIVASYAEAIIDFLSGANRCRGILASRHFRGPSDNTFSKFQILPLSSKRITRLIRNSNLKPKLKDDLIGQLPNAPFEIREMVQNPMFLSLLCQHMDKGNAFPSNSHMVFESYISARLDRDKDRIKDRFNITVQEVRQTAENIAFAMLEAKQLGLNPSRKALETAIIQQNLPLSPRLMDILDILVYIKLAKSDDISTVESKHDRTFSFAHRRFQEYFATSFLLRNPDRIDINRLALDARWRETMVVLLQTQTEEQVKRYLVGIENILDVLTKNQLKQINQVQLTSSKKKRVLPTPFPWPPKLIHLLGLLQDGLASRPHLLAEDTREDLSKILKFAYYQGILLDKKWAIEVASTIKNEDFLQLIRDSLSSTSNIIQDIVYKQIPRLIIIPADVNDWIREVLLTKYGSFALYRERFTLEAYLTRMPNSRGLLKALDILLFTFLFNVIIHGVLFYLYIYGITFYPKSYTAMGNDVFILYAINYIETFIDIRIFYVLMVTTFLLFSLMYSIFTTLLVRVETESVSTTTIIPFHMITLFLPFFIVDSQIIYLYIISLTLYYIICLYSSIYAVKWNKYRLCFFYPIIPITLLFEVFIDLEFIKSKMIYLIKDSPIVEMYKYLFYVGLPFLFLSILVSLFSKQPIQEVFVYLFLSIYALILILGIIIGLLNITKIKKKISAYIRRYLNGFQDNARWMNWNYDGRIIESGDSLLKFIRSFHTPRYFSRIISILRQDQNIDNVDDIESVIIQIMRCVEYLQEVRGPNPIPYRIKDKPLDPADLDVINRILDTPPFQPSDYRWIMKLDSRDLDQLTLFLEHLRRIKNTSASKVSLQQL